MQQSLSVPSLYFQSPSFSTNLCVYKKGCICVTSYHTTRLRKILTLYIIIITIRTQEFFASHMVTMIHLKYHVLLVLVVFLLSLSLISVSGRPVSFLQDFRVTWADSHVRQMNGGKAIQLVLDQSSGCGFASKQKYLFGRVSMKIKLIPGDSAGTVTAFYMISEAFNIRDEFDFEFLGNRSGQPYTMQTNIYINGQGNREQRINLWFDPSQAFHTYSIRWSHQSVVFYVDNIPVRVYRNHEAKGIPFPKNQPMGVYSTLWEADDWATRGGLEKIDWSKAPFYAYYSDFDIEGCPVPGPAACPSNPNNWWEAATFQQLTPLEARTYHWVRATHMIYDYCTDRARNPVPPPECLAGI